MLAKHASEFKTPRRYLAAAECNYGPRQAYVRKIRSNLLHCKRGSTTSVGRVARVEPVGCASGRCSPIFNVSEGPRR